MRSIWFRAVFVQRRLYTLLRTLIRDDRAQALTEYVVLMLVVSTVCFWLYYPHNGIFHAFRMRYDLTALLLALPGP